MVLQQVAVQRVTLLQRALLSAILFLQISTYLQTVLQLPLQLALPTALQQVPLLNVTLMQVARMQVDSQWLLGLQLSLQQLSVQYGGQFDSLAMGRLSNVSGCKVSCGGGRGPR